MSVSVPNNKSVLFVDEEQDLLDGLRDALRKYRHEWRLRFAISGDAALSELQHDPADVVVTDIQMPGMNGAALLAEVQDRYPATIRIVLSGYADAEVVARAATAAHRIMAKPCDADELGHVLERSLALHELTEQAHLYRASVAATTLPSRPGLYMEIASVIADTSSGPEDIAAVIERDTAMTAKVLQLANSAFFGVGRTVTRVKDAVINLGADTIKSLTLSAEAFGKLAPASFDGFSIERFQRHATLAARVTAAILRDDPCRHEAITAALLHDIGQLVSISDDRTAWLELVQASRRRSVPLHELEREREGVTHAATGAYLLSLWGLPLTVIEAVARHHDPGTEGVRRLDAVAAVHIADVLAHQAQPAVEYDPAPPTICPALAERYAPQIDSWRQVVADAA